MEDNENFLSSWRHGDEVGARIVFDRYAARLVALARRRLACLVRVRSRVRLQRVVISLITVTMIGCARDQDLAMKTPPASSSKDQNQKPAASVRFLALGDSYTIGTSIAESERWPLQLAELLRKDGFKLEAPTIIARTGWTSGELLAGINSARPKGVFEVVSLQIGVNNQYRGLDEQQYVRELDELIDLAIEFAGGDPSRVVVLSIPDWGVTSFAADRDGAGIAREIERFNKLKHDRTHRHGCHFVDVTPLSREAADDPSLLASDGLHPSGKMYAHWCELALPTVRLAVTSGSNE